MTHDLTRETLAYLEFQRDDKLRVDANRTAMGMVPTDAWRKDAAMYAHAAACVRRVPELEAEVERLLAKAAVVDAINAGEVEQVSGWGNADGPMKFGIQLKGSGPIDFGFGATMQAAYDGACIVYRQADTP